MAHLAYIMSYGKKHCKTNVAATKPDGSRFVYIGGTQEGFVMKHGNASR